MKKLFRKRYSINKLLKCQCNLNNNRKYISNPLERNLFRFNYNLKTNFLHINYFEPISKNWDKDHYY
jgi:hypothetical protein